MKIIISTNVCHDISKRRNLINTLIDQGHQISVIAGRDMYEETILRNMKINLIKLDIKNRSKNIFSNLNVIHCYKEIYKTEKPDIVMHFNIKPNIYGTMAASKLKIYSINNITGLGDAFEKKSILQTFIMKLYKKAFRSKYCFVFFQNKDDKAFFIKNKLIKEEQTDLLPGSGVDLDFFNPSSMGENPKKDKIEFVFIGRLVLSKGIREYIAAAEEIRKTHTNCIFHIFGSLIEGDSKFIPKHELEQAFNKGIVKYHGFLDEDKLRDILFFNTDCVVFPSYYREGVPRVMLEGAAMAKPLIGADSIGTREPIMHGINGYLCEPRNIKDLTTAIEKFLSLTPAERAAMGQASANLVRERFSEKIVIRKYLERIKEILNTKF